MLLFRYILFNDYSTLLLIHHFSINHVAMYVVTVHIYRNDIIKSTWLEDPDDRPTFAMIVQNLNSICDFSEISTTDESSIRDTDDTAESNDSVN